MVQEGSGSRDSLTSLNSQFSLTENQIKVTSFKKNLISWKIMYFLKKITKIQNIERTQHWKKIDLMTGMFQHKYFIYFFMVLNLNRYYVDQPLYI